jgi:hypothetical protein
MVLAVDLLGSLAKVLDIFCLLPGLLLSCASMIFNGVMRELRAKSGDGVAWRANVSWVWRSAARRAGVIFQCSLRTLVKSLDRL